MTIRFIHTADWQLGKPFRQFPPGLAGELAAARLAVIPRIAALARGKDARHVLVAGDVFDTERLSNIDLRRAFEHMAEQNDIRWLLLPGNHDPSRIGGLWERIARLGVPENVTPLLEAAPYHLAPDAILLPAPLTSKNPGRDPTEWMDTAATAPGIARIGLAHGSVQGFGSEGESAVQIARDRAARAGLAYLALGDWHGTKSITGNTWYSGTPEPDRFPDNEPGHVLAVAIEGERLTEVQKIESATFSWSKMQHTVRSFADFPAIERAISTRTTTPRTLLLQLALSGSLSLADHAALDKWRETWSGKLRHLDIDASGVAVEADAEDIGNLGGSGALADAARHLMAIAADRTHPEHEIAATALVRLYGFAAETEREAAS